MTARIRVGVSGYDYPEWQGAFYPPSLPHRSWLRYAAERFDSIELNGTFYGLKTPRAFERWASVAGGDAFVFAVQGSAFITHRLRLKRPVTALANFYASGVLALGRRTGPFLWQLPPELRFDPARVEGFLAALPADSAEAERLARRHDERLPREPLLHAPARAAYRHALEVRDESYAVPDFYALLRAKGAALVVSDAGVRFPPLEEPTADFMYVRLHGPREIDASGYTAQELDRWAARVSAWRARGQDVYVYFDHNVEARAPFDALELRRRLSEPTRSRTD